MPCSNFIASFKCKHDAEHDASDASREIIAELAKCIAATIIPEVVNKNPIIISMSSILGEMCRV